MNAISLEIKAVIIAVIVAAIFAAGWSVNGWRLGNKLADLQRNHAVQVATAATLSAKRLADAMSRGDLLSAKLAAVEADLKTATGEKENAIKRLTTGRPCLGSAAVRVLNGAGPALKPPAMPQAASLPVSADGAFATDTDVGVWISSCQGSYETCRARLQAVADFFSTDPSIKQEK